MFFVKCLFRCKIRFRFLFRGFGNRACEVQRVAGAWAALIAGPTVMSAIDIVYETEVDEFDNEELYTQGAYFILRAIMKMHGTEI